MVRENIILLNVIDCVCSNHTFVSGMMILNPLKVYFRAPFCAVCLCVHHWEVAQGKVLREDATFDGKPEHRTPSCWARKRSENLGQLLFFLQR